MQLAESAWEKNNAAATRGLLAGLRPRDGEEDLRGLEWDYLWRLCHAERRTLTGHAGFVSGLAFSADGKRLATIEFDGHLKVREADTGREVGAVALGRTRVLSLAFADDDRAIRVVTEIVRAKPGPSAPPDLADVLAGKKEPSLAPLLDGFECRTWSPGDKSPGPAEKFDPVRWHIPLGDSGLAALPFAVALPTKGLVLQPLCLAAAPSGGLLAVGAIGTESGTVPQRCPE